MEYNNVLVNVYQGYINACCNNPEKGLEYYDKAIKTLENSKLSEEEKDELRFNTYIVRSHAYIELKEFDRLGVEIDKCKELASKLQNKFQYAWIDLMLAYGEINKENPQKGIQILSDIEISHPLKNYYLGLAYEKEGDLNSAKKYYNEIINSKESGLNLAMYYKRVKEKLNN